MDEKAVRKGHGYVTVIFNGQTGELLHIAEGKKKESVKAFLEQPTDKQRSAIVAVGLDRAGSYATAVEAYLPNADIVRDRFHLVMNVNQAVDEVRRSQWRAARKEDRTHLKGHRFLILANQDRLDLRGHQKLDALLKTNEPLAKAYLLKEQFRALFSNRSQGRAQHALENWWARARESGRQPFQRLTKGFLKQSKRGPASSSGMASPQS